MKRIWLIFVIVITILTNGCVDREMSVEQKIRDSLVGEKMTYYNIAGQPINFTISANDIKSIEKVEIKDKVFWKIRVGDDLAWDIYFDKDGKKIVRKEQLFVT